MQVLAAGPNPWVYLLFGILILGGGILLLSVITSLAIAYAAGKYSDKTLAKYQKMVEEMLPGTDCGKCKKCSCAEFADAVIHTEIDEYACPYITEDTVQKILQERERLQKLMEAPTPPEKKGPRFWERKF